MITRRQFTSGCLGLAAAAVGAPRFAVGTSLKRLAAVIDDAIVRAVQFLAEQQSPDGAWRSSVYGPLKDGPSLTGFVAATIARIESHPQARLSFDRAVEYLAGIDPGAGGTTYPVYAAAGAVIALGCRSTIGCAASRDTWLAFLRRQQLVETLGWQESDDSFGGFSFAHERPKPIDGRPPSPMAVPNLSATVFALDAIRSAGCSADDAAIQKALAFVERCQNWCDDETAGDSRFDDGGFYFLQGDPTRNKAGEAGVDATGRTRYVSYGSATADGLRALLACGLSTEHPRVRAARRWLVGNFSAENHPGGYPSDREYLRPALYYYFCASAAEALLISSPRDGDSRWAAELAQALFSRQRQDGSWRNSAVDVREDDPLVATPLAISALVAAKATLA